MAKKAKDLTLKQKAVAMRAMLVELRGMCYYYPDSDSREYCAGCGHSPYNIPAHAPGCVVVRLSDLLKRV